MDEFLHLKRWFAAIRARPAVDRAYRAAAEINTAAIVTPASRAFLFGQTSARAEEAK
jgi:GST-like protein